MLCLYIYKPYISHFLLVQIIIFPHEHPPSSDVHLKELAARAPQTAAAGLGLGERQMFPQHLQGSRSKGASWKSYPICSMCGIFIYIWVIFRANGGKYSIHGAYGYHCVSVICSARILVLIPLLRRSLCGSGESIWGFL